MNRSTEQDTSESRERRRSNRRILKSMALAQKNSLTDPSNVVATETHSHLRNRSSHQQVPITIQVCNSQVDHDFPIIQENSGPMEAGASIREKKTADEEEASVNRPREDVEKGPPPGRETTTDRGRSRSCCACLPPGLSSMLRLIYLLIGILLLLSMWPLAVPPISSPPPLPVPTEQGKLSFPRAKVIKLYLLHGHAEKCFQPESIIRYSNEASVLSNRIADQAQNLASSAQSPELESFGFIPLKKTAAGASSQLQTLASEEQEIRSRREALRKGFEELVGEIAAKPIQQKIAHLKKRSELRHQRRQEEEDSKGYLQKLIQRWTWILNLGKSPPHAFQNEEKEDVSSELKLLPHYVSRLKKWSDAMQALEEEWILQVRGKLTSSLKKMDADFCPVFSTIDDQLFARSDGREESLASGHVAIFKLQQSITVFCEYLSQSRDRLVKAEASSSPAANELGVWKKDLLKVYRDWDTFTKTYNNARESVASLDETDWEQIMAEARITDKKLLGLAFEVVKVWGWEVKELEYSM